MLINIYKQLHDSEDNELCVSGDIHPANLGYWVGVLFEPDSSITIEIKDEEFDSTMLEEDVERTIH